MEEGDEVSSYYDPMLGKIIAWGETRAQATALLRRALGEIEIVGVATNRALLLSVLADEEFRQGGVATDFLTGARSRLRFDDPAAERPIWRWRRFGVPRGMRRKAPLGRHPRLAIGGAGGHDMSLRHHIAMVEALHGSAYAVRVSDEGKQAGASEF